MDRAFVPSDPGSNPAARPHPLLARLRQIAAGFPQNPATHFLPRWIFLRLLGIVYLCAFASLWPQIVGLAGAHGILPAHTFLAAVAHSMGAERYRLIPTLAWLNSSDAFLKFLAGSGTALSILLILGVAEGPVLVALWVFYLSLSTAGQDFMAFQWDILLLEAGFLAIFLAPWSGLASHWRAAGRAARPPSRIIVWLLRWLLFRLMFLSGCVKLLSGDRNWRNLTALEYHYHTQPLPTPLAWYAAQLPAWFQKCSVALVFVIEIGVPFLIFCPRKIRFIGCAVLAGFQVLIALTGNYAFFNLLAITLCVMLLDDQLLSRVLPRALVRRVMPAAAEAGRSMAKRIGLAALAAVILFGSGVLVIVTLAGPRSVPRPALAVTGWLEPFHIVSSYGLFAVMTTSRVEILIQGSDDGVHWTTYPFKYKPGKLNKAPGWVAPYQPRLDWQMWFAALSNYRQNPWFVNLMIRLLQGSPPVLALLGPNPFPAAPPRYVRAVAYEYNFTNFAGRKKTGDWWMRTPEGLYFPVAGMRR